LGPRTYIRFRGENYQWRKRLSKGVAKHLGRKELILSLRTGDKRRAVQLASILNFHFDSLVAIVETSISLTPNQLQEIARRWLREELAAAESVLADSGKRTVERNARGQAAGQQLLKDLSDALEANDLSMAKGSVKALIEREGLSIAEDSSEFRQLSRLILRAGAEGAKQVQTRLAGQYSAPATDPMFANLEVAAPDAILPAAKPMALQSARLSLKDFIEKHLISQTRKWESHTLAQNRSTLRMLQEFVGDIPATKLDRRQIGEFIDALAKLPARYGQLPAYRSKTLPEMLTIAQKAPTSVPRLTQKTLNRHASTISGLFTWAKQQGLWSGDNPASGFIDKRPTGAGPARRPWRKDELERLFKSPPWAGCQSKSQRLVPGKQIIRDGYFYIPLLALFTGMRLEEICKLTVDDMRTDGNITVIDVVGNAEGRVKEEASNRTVPVHPELRKLGFLDHVEKIRKATGDRLWPEFGRTGKKQKIGTAFTKWFGRLKSDAGITDPGVVFHSFRKNVATALHAAGVPESTAADILGHEHKSMSYRVYSAGTTAKPLFDAICKIDYSIDFSHLHVERRSW
jgi:integrase